jgi:hypothetical protein
MVLDAKHLPYVVELELAVEEGSDPVCQALRLVARDGGEPVSARRVREIPLAECMQIATTTAMFPVERDSAGRVTSVRVAPGKNESELAEAWKLASGRPRPVSSSDEHLRKVAAVYMKASEKPTRAVQDAFGPVSHSTAARWVGQARRRGFLPPAERTYTAKR